MEILSKFCKCFIEISRIKMYLASETLDTFLLMSIMPCLLSMLTCMVLQNVVMNNMDIGSQSTVHKFASMSSTSQQCEKNDVTRVELLISPRTTVVSMSLSRYPQCLPSPRSHRYLAMFLQLTFLMCSSLAVPQRYQCCIQHLIHSMASFLL